MPAVPPGGGGGPVDEHGQVTAGGLHVAEDVEHRAGLGHDQHRVLELGEGGRPAGGLGGGQVPQPHHPGDVVQVAPVDGEAPVARAQRVFERLVDGRLEGKRDDVGAGDGDGGDRGVADGKGTLDEFQVGGGDFPGVGRLGRQPAQFGLGDRRLRGDALARGLQVGEEQEHRDQRPGEDDEDGHRQGDEAGHGNRVAHRHRLGNGLGVDEHDDGEQHRGDGDPGVPEVALGDDPGDGGCSHLDQQHHEEHGVEHPGQVPLQAQQAGGGPVAPLGGHLEAHSRHPQQGGLGGGQEGSHQHHAEQDGK
jgi:hypothetical protein